MSQFDKVIEIAEKNKNIITAKQARENGISPNYLAILVGRNELYKVERGIYAIPDTYVDEMFVFQNQHRLSIFSHQTALYLHEMTDRTPLKLSITLPRDYRATKLIEQNEVILFRCNRDIRALGLINMLSPSGHLINVYDIERTICDIVRNAEAIDKQVFNEAMKIYSRNSNITKLIKYAKQLKVEGEVRRIMEILL